MVYLVLDSEHYFIVASYMDKKQAATKARTRECSTLWELDPINYHSYAKLIYRNDPRWDKIDLTGE